ncbi:MAG: cytochrome C biosynthesis protein [Tannerellaceae bacterium]|jgi:hypothetical protein|nr:cytochrome C biosynthesis protein [Tannerellaceae bacterium]
MKRCFTIAIIFQAAAAIPLLLCLSGCARPAESSGDIGKENRLPEIYPDFTNIAVPINIAPVNFRINEPGDRFRVRISGVAGRAISMISRRPDVRIGAKAWRKLLEDNAGDTITISVEIGDGNGWRRFEGIRNYVSPDSIDPFMVYRDIAPADGLWNRMGMQQRNLETFEETEIINNYRIEHNCMNCHTFHKNNPARFLFHVRGSRGGTVFYNNGKLGKKAFPVPEVLSHGAYCQWSPNGRLVAFAVNNIRQNYYITGHERKMKEVFDLESDIVLYDTDAGNVFTFPQISTEQRENLPAWSAGGETLYFVSAWPHAPNTPNEEALYSLMQAGFDVGEMKLGEPSVLLAAEEVGGSISFPTVSPDGRFMLFCVTDFGYFPVTNKTADIYIMDLKTNEYRRPAINSDESESYMSWSSSGRWFVFSSRRLDGMNSRPFVCHVDELGNISKPFVVPQESPDYYETDHRNFSRPELIKGPIPLRFNDLAGAIFSEPEMIGVKN